MNGLLIMLVGIAIMVGVIGWLGMRDQKKK